MLRVKPCLFRLKSGFNHHARSLIRHEPDVKQMDMRLMSNQTHHIVTGETHFWLRLKAKMRQRVYFFNTVHHAVMTMML